MKKKYLKLLAIGLITPFLYTGCSEDDDEVAPLPAIDEALLLGTWRISEATISPAYDYNQDGTKETNIYAVMKDCEKDDWTILASGNAYADEEGPSKCEDNDPYQDELGTWTYNKSSRSIEYVPIGDTPYEEKIFSLSATELKGQSTQTINGTTYKVNFTAVKYTPSASDIFMGVWTMTAARMEPGLDLDLDGNITEAEKDVYNSLFDACDKDDFFKFMSGNKYEVNEGVTKCDPSDPQIEDNGTWTLSNSNTMLSLDNGRDVTEYTITQSSNTEMTLVNFDATQGQTTTYTFEK